MGAWGGVRRWTRLLWASYRGIAPLVLLVVALVLGYLGHRGTSSDAGEPRPWYDLLYFDLQLLTFNTRSASDPSAALPWSLQIARFMAPLVAGYGAVVGILRLFRDRFDHIARFSRHHAVVVGASSTGLAFVRSLRADGRKVVLVDENGSNPIAEACRELGALVLEADARHPESLVQAGLGAADHLVAVSGDDGTNVEVVVNADRSVVGWPNPFAAWPTSSTPTCGSSSGPTSSRRTRPVRCSSTASTSTSTAPEHSSPTTRRRSGRTTGRPRSSWWATDRWQSGSWPSWSADARPPRSLSGRDDGVGPRGDLAPSATPPGGGRPRGEGQPPRHRRRLRPQRGRSNRDDRGPGHRVRVRRCGQDGGRRRPDASYEPSGDAGRGEPHQQ